MDEKRTWWILHCSLRFDFWGGRNLTKSREKLHGDTFGCTNCIFRKRKKQFDANNSNIHSSENIVLATYINAIRVCCLLMCLFHVVHKKTRSFIPRIQGREATSSNHQRQIVSKITWWSSELVDPMVDRIHFFWTNDMFRGKKNC